MMAEYRIISHQLATEFENFSVKYSIYRSKKRDNQCLQSILKTKIFKEKDNKVSKQHYDHPYAKKIIINHATSQISTQYLNNKCQKIDYQYFYDHQCAINIMNDLLNDDCLAEVFTYVPACERPKLALVCQKWNRALHRSWFDLRKIELSHWAYDECPNILKKNPTIGDGFTFLRSLLDKCGRYLTELDLAAYDKSKIMPVINESCPNLVKLRLRFIYIINEELKNSFSNMSKLKILKIIFQSRFGIPHTLLNSLKDVADTLNELSLASWNGCKYNCEIPHFFVTVISQLNALRQIEFFGIKINSSLYDYLQNAKLNFYHHDNIIKPEAGLRMYLSYDIAVDIRVLELFNREMTDDFLYNVANNTKTLNTLDASCKFITDVGIKTIAKINTLRNLRLRCSNNNLITDSSIQLLTNLERLHLPGSKKITDYSATKIIENSPKLKYLSCVGTSVTSEFIKKASEKLLQVYIDSDFMNMQKYESPYLGTIEDDVFYSVPGYKSESFIRLLVT